MSKKKSITTVRRKLAIKKKATPKYGAAFKNRRRLTLPPSKGQYHQRNQA